MTVSKCILGFLIAVLLLSNAAEAQIYKWVDKDGVVHYSDQPGDDNAVVSSDIESKRTDTAAASEKLAAAQKLRDEQSQAFYARRTGADEPKMSPEEAEFHRKSCDAARKKMNQFAQARRLYKVLDNGEKAYLTDEEILDARAEVQRAIGEHCK
ncbi:MAG: DUF4124 domain-containing protein [Woeseiaceae bacterium]